MCKDKANIAKDNMVAKGLLVQENILTLEAQFFFDRTYSIYLNKNNGRSYFLSFPFLGLISSVEAIERIERPYSVLQTPTYATLSYRRW